MTRNIEMLFQVARGLGDLCPEFRRFLVEPAKGWLANARFLEARPGHLPGDSASQLRDPIVLRRLREIANL